MNLAYSATRDSAAGFLNLTLGRESTRHPPRQRHHECVLSGWETQYEPTADELGDFRILGVDVEFLSVSRFPIAYILNVHFKGGEWGNYPRCGSVITCVLRGQSFYARVNRFLYVHGDKCPGYASVSWFSKPRYLFDGETPLGVCVTADGNEIDREFGSVIRITQIDPSRIMVEPSPTNDCYMMMRDSGYDTRANPVE